VDRDEQHEHLCNDLENAVRDEILPPNVKVVVGALCISVCREDRRTAEALPPP